MNLVFFKTLEELEKTMVFFPEDDFVLARIIQSEKEWNSFRQFASQKTRQKFCVVLEKTDSRLLQKARQAGFLTGVLGNSPKNCLFCVQQKTDFLFLSFSSGRPSWDLSVLRVAKQNKVKVGLFFSEVLNALPKERIKWFGNVFFLARACKKMKVGLAVFSASFSFEESRSEKDLEEFTEMLKERF